MSKYNPETDMPTTLTQWNELVDYFTAKSANEHEAAVAAAPAQAEAAYSELPDTDNKPTLADYIAQAISSIPPAEPREYFEKMYACYYPQPAPEPEPEPTEADLFAQLRSIREVKFREYDKVVSQLERKARIGEAVATQLAAWDAYAIALCELPEQPGAPWDGGGSQTPWPVKP